jgi:hypothetical protein
MHDFLFSCHRNATALLLSWHDWYTETFLVFHYYGSISSQVDPRYPLTDVVHRLGTKLVAGIYKPEHKRIGFLSGETHGRTTGRDRES